MIPEIIYMYINWQILKIIFRVSEGPMHVAAVLLNLLSSSTGAAPVHHQLQRHWPDFRPQPRDQNFTPAVSTLTEAGPIFTFMCGMSSWLGPLPIHR